MYRLLVIALSAFSVVVLALIIATVAWRDDWAGDDKSSGSTSANLRSENIGSVGYESGPGRSVLSRDELPALRQQLLRLINDQRTLARVTPLVLGDNPAAQLHADSMMAYGYRSHWDPSGLTPQMRYTLSGGTGRVLENIAGPVAMARVGAAGPETIGPALADAHTGFMASPEEAANVLDPWHRRVNLGIACNVSHCWVVQQFESDHISFTTLPTIEAGIFRAAGEFQPGLELDNIAIWRHPYPRLLSLGQLDATYRYGYGRRPVTFLRPPPPAGIHYPDTLVNYEWENGIDPYTLDPGLSRSPAPPLAVEVVQSAAVSWTTATRWEQSGPSFLMEADLSTVLEALGAGVYTVQIWGRQGEERLPLTNYTIFVE